MHKSTRGPARLVLVAVLLFFFGNAGAQVVITAATVAAGGITTGDTAGYPATISTAGSFRLGSNLSLLTSPTGTHAIDITGSDVVLDLNGFSIRGKTTCTKVAGQSQGNSCVGVVPNSQFLIYITGSRVTVKNGTVLGSEGAGIAIDTDQVHLQSLHISNNKGEGIAAVALITGVSAIRTGLELIDVTSSMNGGLGLRGPGQNEGTVNIRDSTFSDNNGGLLMWHGNVSDVIASYNSIYGIRAGRANLTHATVYDNNGDGISGGATIRDSIADSNTTGFVSDAEGTLYVNASASWNSLGFNLGPSGCYTNVNLFQNVTNFSGGVAITGTHVTCP